MDSKPTATADAAPDSPQAVDEVQLQEAMKRLKLLHIKERLLRDTIPRIIEPLVKKHSSPDVMFNAFMKAVTEAQAEVTEFAELMRDDATKQVFAQADKSREENPFGIKPWRHMDHPNWFNLDKD